MRYLLLVLLNLPVILLALVNVVTQFKLKRVSVSRFRHQLILWTAILLLLIGSYPVYNMLKGGAPFDSTGLSVFDILQTTAIIFLLYFSNQQRQQNDQNEKRLRDLHQALSIKLSDDK